jgi:beta-phosphoglucomutase-like phosphatase (HAD superfamily)
MKLTAAILDMDEVVVDIVPLQFLTSQEMAEEYGRPFPSEDYNATVDGTPRIDGVRASTRIDSYCPSSRLKTADLVIGDAGEITPEQPEQPVAHHVNPTS